MKKIKVLCTLLLLTAGMTFSSYAATDGFTSGESVKEIGAAGESYEGESGNDTAPVEVTRSEDDAEQMRILIREIDEELGTEESKEGEGTLTVILREEEVPDKAVRVVLYGADDERIELDLLSEKAYTEKMLLPAGDYNVLGAYPLLNEGEVSKGFYDTPDYVTVRKDSDSTLEVSVNKAYEEHTIPALDEEEISAAEGARENGKVQGTLGFMVMVLVGSLTLISATFAIHKAGKKH